MMGYYVVLFCILVVEKFILKEKGRVVGWGGVSCFGKLF